MRWTAFALVLLVSSACAADPLPAPMVPAAGAATLEIAIDPVIRRTWPNARRPGTQVVAEIHGSECIAGMEMPSGSKLGIWLEMPRSACQHDLATPADVPLARSATNEVLWHDNVVEPAALQHLVNLGAPIEWLEPADGIFVARRMLAKVAAAHPELPSAPELRRAQHALELYEDDGRTMTDRSKLLGLCAKKNDEACLRAVTGAQKPERRALLTRSCQLENSNACYALGLDLRADALSAIQRTKEVEELRDFRCGIGKSVGLTPVLYESQPCPPPTVPIAH